MTASSPTHFLNGLVNQVLAIKPLWNFAKGRARAMMVKRAESIGVPWRTAVQSLQSRQGSQGFAAAWQDDLKRIENPDLVYPHYYTTSFHAYDEGNLGWRPAMEVEVAAKAVHARIWPEAGAAGDARLRQSYHDLLRARLPATPKDVIDLGCGIGMSTKTLQQTFPTAHLTGVDLSPYFLAVAQYRPQEPVHVGSSPAADAKAQAAFPIQWHHATAEATGLPDGAYDLVSLCLVFHELPQTAARRIIQEAHRLLRPGGHLAIMDMNPESEVLQRMPAFVFTLLKSTEPYLDEYFALDLPQEFRAAGFAPPTVDVNSPRHRTVIGRKGVTP